MFKSRAQVCFHHGVGATCRNQEKHAAQSSPGFNVSVKVREDLMC